jgi:hypothetical protein
MGNLESVQAIYVEVQVRKESSMTWRAINAIATRVTSVVVTLRTRTDAGTPPPRSRTRPG